MKKIKYQVVNCNALRIRKLPSIYAKTLKYLHRGDYVNIICDSAKKVDGIVWYRCDEGYVSSNYLKRITPNYLKRVQKNSKLVYNKIIEIGCKHKGGAYSYEDIKAKKVTTCGSAVSAVLQESGVLKKGKLISHTPKGGNKDTISKAISGVSNLVPDTYTILPVNCKFKDLEISYKKSGVVHIYDSNIAINAGDGYIYSCNNGDSQLKEGRYIKDKMKSGYCFDSKILYVLIPNS